MFVIIVIYAYFVDISQGSVETDLWSGGICNKSRYCKLSAEWDSERILKINQ